MDVLKITGGRPLTGTIKAAGAKNATTKLLVASLLSDQPCIFENVPNIGDVEVTVALCKEIGANVQWDRENGVLEICTPQLRSSYVPQRFSGANRIPILMIGALLSRTQEDIIVPTVGGCHLGLRSVDFHLDALQRLGASVEYRKMKTEGAYFASAHNGLQGSLIQLPYPSVGATENCILAAVGARGVTVIKNAATEPEIIELILFLQQMGVNITQDQEKCIRIEQARQFRPVRHRILSDRIEVASYAAAAVATDGRVCIKGAKQEHLMTFLRYLSSVGGGFEVQEDGMVFYRERTLSGGLHIETDVHPGFMTDWQQPFVVLLTQAQGSCVVHETVYEKRFGYTRTLCQMGADIELVTHCLGGKPCRFASQNFEHSIIVRGPTPLVGTSIKVPDLRAGFAYVMAALLAEDETTISGVHFLDRGYEDIVGKLQSLDAQVVREEQPVAKDVVGLLDAMQPRPTKV